MYKILSIIAVAIFAYLAGRAQQDAKAAKAYVQLSLDYQKTMDKISAMDSTAIDAELQRRLRDSA